MKFYNRAGTLMNASTVTVVSYSTDFTTSQTLGNEIKDDMCSGQDAAIDLYNINSDLMVEFYSGVDSSETNDRIGKVSIKAKRGSLPTLVLKRYNGDSYPPDYKNLDDQNLFVTELPVFEPDANDGNKDDVVEVVLWVVDPPPPPSPLSPGNPTSPPPRWPAPPGARAGGD